MPPRLALSGDALETIKVVTNRHGQGQQLFERLLRLVELDGDAARFQPHASREMRKFLGKDLKGSFDQEPGPREAVFVQLGEDGGDLSSALLLIAAVVAGGEAAEVGDEGGAIGQTAGADVVGNAGSHDLLSAAGADAEEELDSGAVDEGAGERLQLQDDVVDSAEPGGFGGHKVNSPC
jgi:hypothetical protein